jgi:phosphohistidine phosphatase
MKTLTLLRHAKSTWDDPVQRDFDRPLNDRGRKAARTIGREMQAKGLHFDKVLASPAIRVIETLSDVAEGYGQPIEPEFDKRIYLAAAEALLEFVQTTDDDVSGLLIVGHNPGLENLVLMLSRESALRGEVAVKYPTATLAEISLPIQHWSEAREGTGTLTRLIRPRDLDPELGPEL